MFLQFTHVILLFSSIFWSGTPATAQDGSGGLTPTSTMPYPIPGAPGFNTSALRNAFGVSPLSVQRDYLATTPWRETVPLGVQLSATKMQFMPPTNSLPYMGPRLNPQLDPGNLERMSAINSMSMGLVNTRQALKQRGVQDLTEVLDQTNLAVDKAREMSGDCLDQSVTGAKLIKGVDFLAKSVQAITTEGVGKVSENIVGELRQTVSNPVKELGAAVLEAGKADAMSAALKTAVSGLPPAAKGIVGLGILGATWAGKLEDGYTVFNTAGGFFTDVSPAESGIVRKTAGNIRLGKQAADDATILRKIASGTPSGIKKKAAAGAIATSLKIADKIKTTDKRRQLTEKVPVTIENVKSESLGN